MTFGAHFRLTVLLGKSDIQEETAIDITLQSGNVIKIAIPGLIKSRYYAHGLLQGIAVMMRLKSLE